MFHLQNLVLHLHYFVNLLGVKVGRRLACEWQSALTGRHIDLLGWLVQLESLDLSLVEGVGLSKISPGHLGRCLVSLKSAYLLRFEAIIFSSVDTSCLRHEVRLPGQQGVLFLSTFAYLAFRSNNKSLLRTGPFHVLFKLITDQRGFTRNLFLRSNGT
jgi:hypothetical protein